jgi:TolA-binding protein
MPKRVITCLLILLVAVTACSKKKTEQEYFTLAYDQYNKGQNKEALENFENLLKYYAQGTEAPKAMFMIGFICANNTKEYDKAREYYTKFIEKYPQHELVKSAQYELDTMGQDINLLPNFQETDKDSAVTETTK